MVLKTKLIKMYIKTGKYICMANINNKWNKYNFCV